MADHGRYARFRNETLCVRPVTAGTFLLRRDTGTPGRPERPGRPGDAGWHDPRLHQRGAGHGVDRGSSQPRLPSAARTALRRGVRGGRPPGGPGDRGAGRVRRPVHRTRGVRGDPLPQLRLRTRLPAHVPGRLPDRPGVLGPRERTGPGRPGRIRTPASAHGRVPGRPFAPPHRSRRHPRGERRAASRVHDERHRHGGGRFPGSRRGARLRRPGLSAHTAPGRRGGGARRREGRTPDPAAGRPARRGRALPAGRPAAARGVRAAGRREHRAARHLGPAARGRGRAGHLGGVAGP